MKECSTMSAIQRFFDNNTILQYPNLIYRSFTLKKDRRFFRIYNKSNGRYIIEIFYGREVRISLL